VATVRGVHDYDDQLPRFDDGWLAEMASVLNGIVKDARALDTALMTTQEKITLSLLLHQCESALDTIETPFLLASIDPFLGPHTRLLSDTRQNTVTNTEQAYSLLERYAKVPVFLAVKAHRRLAQVLPRKISITDLFRFPTVRALAEYATDGSTGPSLAQSQDRAELRKSALARRRGARAGARDRNESDDA
jgi:hypothetical protein